MKTNKKLEKKKKKDFFVWGAAERDTNKTPCNTKDELVKRIRAVFKRFSKEVMVHVPRPY